MKETWKGESGRQEVYIIGWKKHGRVRVVGRRYT